jgi:trimeric autotransporter adhesin
MKQYLKILAIVLIIKLSETKLQAQSIGINNAGIAPATSAMLDIVSTTRGVLMPRIALTSTTDVSTVASPATSLLIYNTATASSGITAVSPGYYYFDGVKWISLEGKNGSNWSLLGNIGTNATTNFIGTTDNQDVVFKANTRTIRMLASNGNIGIGTNNPTSKLTVEGGDVIIGETIGINTVGRSLHFSDYGSNTDAVYFYRQNYASDVSDLNLFMGDNYKKFGGPDRFNIGAADALTPTIFNPIFTVKTDDATVGINQYTPTEALHVVGNERLDGAFMPNNSGGTANAVLVSQGAGTAPQWLGGSTLATNINSVAWILSGNGGLSTITNFIGTTDNVDMVFKRNNIISGLLSTTNTGLGYNSLITATGTENVAIGAYSLASAITASNNVGIGYQTLNLNVSNNNNTAIGNNALRANIADNNTAAGSNALENNTTGNDNTAIGFQALFTNTYGAFNTAIGLNTLLLNTTGSDNVAISRGALGANTSGSSNTSTGTYSMDKNTTGSNNTAIGFSSLQYTTVSNNATAIGNNAIQFPNSTTTPFNNTNVAIGNQALRGSATPASNTGINNTVVGYEAMLNNTSGSQNSCFGFNTLFGNTSGNNNSALGFQALALNQTGNNNTGVGRQAGYTNVVGDNNTANGYGALNFSTVSDNTAVGYFALNKNITGTQNVAIGLRALEQNIARSQNTAIGYQALNANARVATTATQAINNTAVGFNASSDNQLGASNTAVGAFSLVKNTTNNNTAIGYFAANANTTGTGNVAVGFQAIYLNLVGVDNTAVGSGALRLTVGTSSIGSYNTGVGKFALQNQTTGWDNAALGKNTGAIITTGKENTLIGADANVSALGVNNSTALGNGAIATGNNSTALGDNAVSPAANTVRVGNTTVTNIQGQVAYSVVSDGRFKTVTKYEVKGLDFITQLRPVTYTFDTKKYDSFLVKNLSKNEREKHLSKHDYTESSAIVHTGFIAQEVQLAAKRTKFNFDAVHVPVDANDNYSLAYSQFVVPIIQSIQEINNKLETKQLTDADVQLLQQELQLQQLQINTLLQQNNVLINRIKVFEK